MHSRTTRHQYNIRRQNVTCDPVRVTSCILSQPAILIFILLSIASSHRNALFVSAATTANGDPHVLQQQQLAQAAALTSPGMGAGMAASSVLQQFSPNCTAVIDIFEMRGIRPSQVPSKPINDAKLSFCGSPSVGTCCTDDMEIQLAARSRVQLERHSREHVVKMSKALSVRAEKYNDLFRKLLMQSKLEFHNMFTRTYGIIYQQNSEVFSDLFSKLEYYYAHGRINLTAVMDEFFHTLYQKMFAVLNSQYSFEASYLNCVSEHMKELKPFADVPDKLSVQIKRSFVATRTYGQALANAADVARRLLRVRLNGQCTAPLMKMRNCGACNGYAAKPCMNYCANVISGCLPYLSKIDAEWENFVIAMDRVAERLLGSFNIVMVVEPINIKISEAIMNFQEAGQDITNRVFQGCGRPSLLRSRRSMPDRFAAPLTFINAGISNNVDDYIKTNNRAVGRTNESQLIKEHAVVPGNLPETDTDILDIDAALDEAIVLRDRRSADPGQNADGLPSSTTSKANASDGSGALAGVDAGSSSEIGGDGNRNRNNNQRRRPQAQNRRRNNNDDDDNRDPNLDRLVRDIRQRVKESKKFWSTLPHQICSSEEIAASSDVDGMCWNGHTIDRYMHPLSTEHGRNPEFSDNPATATQASQVETQLQNLRNTISHLRNAYNGQDVIPNYLDETYDSSGAGSGVDTDDEDDYDGSGLGSTPQFPPITHKTEHTDRPTGGRVGVDDEDSDDMDEAEERGGGTGDTAHTTRPTSRGGDLGGAVDPIKGQGGIGDNTIDKDEDDESVNENDEDNNIDAHSSSGGTAAKTTPKMSLRRALLLYLLPLYVAWFGGAVADLL